MSVMESPTQYQHQRPQTRPRSKSAFSFRSDQSASSTKSPKRESLTESRDEKRKTHLSQTTKANPNAAINEMQPIAAALEKPTLGDLRSGSYNDQFGNPITEPDLSNPTRPRWERPLDTIRSFEHAIDHEYKTRQSMLRAETATIDGLASRRSSSYWAGGYDTARPRNSTVGGYYAGSNRDSYGENGMPNDGGNYANGPQPNGPPTTPGRYRYNNRQSSDPTLNRYVNPATGIYPAPGYRQSRDTVNTGMTGGSGGSGSEPWVTSTDPSSENSSIDKTNGAPKQEYDGQYGYQNYGANPTFRNPIVEEGGYGPRGYSENGIPGPSTNGYFSQFPAGEPSPALRPKMMNPPPARAPIRLDSSPAVLAQSTGGVPGAASGNMLQREGSTLKKQESPKRKSWFSRRFSKRE